MKVAIITLALSLALLAGCFDNGNSYAVEGAMDRAYNYCISSMKQSQRDCERWMESNYHRF